MAYLLFCKASYTGKPTLIQDFEALPCEAAPLPNKHQDFLCSQKRKAAARDCQVHSWTWL